jgi:succinyl-CoA synthetase beta subunit/citryl-CoA synthetase large subunit
MLWLGANSMTRYGVGSAAHPPSINPVMHPGVMRALKELKIDPETFPVVFRFAGPGTEKAKEMAAEIPGIEYHDASSTIEDVVARIIERTREA